MHENVPVTSDHRGNTHVWLGPKSSALLLWQWRSLLPSGAWGCKSGKWRRGQGETEKGYDFSNARMPLKTLITSIYWVPDMWPTGALGEGQWIYAPKQMKICSSQGQYHCSCDFHNVAFCWAECCKLLKVTFFFLQHVPKLKPTTSSSCQFKKKNEKIAMRDSMSVQHFLRTVPHSFHLTCCL